jgi:hypothetical protein
MFRMANSVIVTRNCQCTGSAQRSQPWARVKPGTAGWCVEPALVQMSPGQAVTLMISINGFSQLHPVQLANTHQALTT